ncbi:FAD-binding domain-containing protein [Daldinia caldariorum]|uniref:FAD-binding domain-containing protein n=1 Tax=Daldinia caldariorum TaxID=326644 RepID=UPI00200751D4|nr:FAD-binding domain-containing protein [Daldinia caldariorum]KAI1463428.1 FAD-binding domain-containing protein [Daldinia caldariorum]
MTAIVGISGDQYIPGSKEYDEVKYQYATSTYGKERDLNPGLIVQPKTKEDIVLVLKHSKEKKVAVAIKTGGHQYSGSSSTSAPNIQLDLRHSFRGSEDRAIFEKDGKTYARTSVSWSLGEFNAWVTEHNLFVPHGQCTEVHVGGHVQTGGYGQLARSFGLFGDHVRSLEIIDSDGNFKEITRATDPDLFWAFLGGSPGNLGVLMHFTIQMYRDQDYKGSRGMKAMYFYNPEILKRLVNILTEMSDDDNFPRNYDLCISVLSSAFPLLDLCPGIDEWMEREHPEFYGENGLIAWPRTIVVFAQWVPFESGDVCDYSWFDRIKEGSDWILGNSAVAEKPMSQLTGDWIFRNVREFEHPYTKRTYTTRSRTLTKDGWADWFVNRVDAIVRPKHNRCWLSAQLQCYGGKNSMFTRNAGNGTAYSWRDTSAVCVMDCFHEDETKTIAEDWQKVNDEEAIGPDGIFSKEDRRLLWGSYGSWDLDSVWNCYYEDRAKYDKLREIRKKADPYGIFTPNPFSVKRAD